MQKQKLDIFFSHLNEEYKSGENGFDFLDKLKSKHEIEKTHCKTIASIKIEEPIA